MDDPVLWSDNNRQAEAGWSEFQKDFHEFMSLAYAERYQPRTYSGDMVIEVGDPTTRSAWLVRRGSRNGWEPFFNEAGVVVKAGLFYGFDKEACICVRPPFRHAGYLLLGWLRGRSLESILSDFDFVGGRPPGIVLRSGTIVDQGPKHPELA